LNRMSWWVELVVRKKAGRGLKIREEEGGAPSVQNTEVLGGGRIWGGMY